MDDFLFFMAHHDGTSPWTTFYRADGSADRAVRIGGECAGHGPLLRRAVAHGVLGRADVERVIVADDLLRECLVGHVVVHSNAHVIAAVQHVRDIGDLGLAELGRLAGIDGGQRVALSGTASVSPLAVDCVAASADSLP